MPLPSHSDNISEFTHDPDILMSPSIPSPTCPQPSAPHNLAQGYCILDRTTSKPHTTRESGTSTVKRKQQRLGELGQLAASSNLESITEHSGPDSSSHCACMSHLGQSCLVCSSAVTGPSKYTCTQKASCCGPFLEYSFPTSTCPLPHPNSCLPDSYSSF